MGTKKVTIKCANCGQSFQTEQPNPGNVSKVTCPHCGNKITIKRNPVQIKMAGLQSSPAITAIGKTLPIPGYKDSYYIKGTALVGRLYKLQCPSCNFSIVKKLIKEGKQGWVCPKCKTSVYFKVIGNASKPKPIVENSTQDKPTVKEEQKTHGDTQSFGKWKTGGELKWRSGFITKHKKLQVGSVTIGRHDKDRPSDIQLNDKYVSRQSATIDVIFDKEKGYLFKFTVRHAANPVYVNTTEIGEGQSVFLDYNDLIKMGQTKITFVKAKSDEN